MGAFGRPLVLDLVEAGLDEREKYGPGEFLQAEISEGLERANKSTFHSSDHPVGLHPRTS